MKRKAKHVVVKAADWFERRWYINIVSALIIGTLAVTGGGEDWWFRAFTVLLCLDTLVEGMGNAIGLGRRLVPIVDDENETGEWNE